MQHESLILAGDIGGTKTVIALYASDTSGTSAPLQQLSLQTYPSNDYLSLESILQAFLAQHGAAGLRAACFGVAGAVVNGQCRTTNLPWAFSEQSLAEAIGIGKVKLLNDLEAAAYGMLFIGTDECITLNAGIPGNTGNIAVIAAGTGLGEAMLYWDGERHHPIASEGGHSDFSPRSDREIELLKYLRQRFGGHVSCERVLSGPGLYNIYQFLRDSGYGSEPAWLSQELRAGDPSASISEHALSGRDPLCAAALDMFCSIYGAEAGNLALQCLSLGGVYIGGGIAPKIIPALSSGAFLDAFLDKGRFAPLLKDMRVSIASNAQAPLLGAAHYTQRR